MVTLVNDGFELTVHMMVRNEEYWIRFALLSAIERGNRVFLWDTGSEDRTVALARMVPEERVTLRRLGPVASNGLCDVRNQMLAETTTPWFAIVDGDEVWPPGLWREVAAFMADPHCNVVVVPACYPFPWLGAFNEEEDDQHEIAGLRGPMAARVFRREEGQRWHGNFGNDGLYDKRAVLLTGGNFSSMRVAKEPFWHMTLLPRSPLDHNTFWRVGKVHTDDPSEVTLREVPRENIPRVFFRNRPPGVADPFTHTVMGFRRRG